MVTFQNLLVVALAILGCRYKALWTYRDAENSTEPKLPDFICSTY